jgi:predicted Co/Zn/Cd cation transporter (cation efflux family)
MQDSLRFKLGNGMQTIQSVPIASVCSNTASNDKEYVTFPVILRWLLVLFAYGWWLIVILPFMLFDTDLPLYLRLQSIPLAMVSFTLAALFQSALNRLQYGFAALFALGLLIAGTLA